MTHQVHDHDIDEYVLKISSVRTSSDATNFASLVTCTFVDWRKLVLLLAKIRWNLAYWRMSTKCHGESHLHSRQLANVLLAKVLLARFGLAAFATSLKPQISIHGHADWRSGTSMVSGAVTWLASVTTKHNHNNQRKYLIIFKAIDSEVMKSSVHFSMSSFRKILLIFHPTCWIVFTTKIYTRMVTNGWSPIRNDRRS